MAIERVLEQLIGLLTLTVFFVLGISGTVGKLLHDDRRVRLAERHATPFILPVIE